jgi:hypothetical protein
MSGPREERRGEALWGAVRSLLQSARLDPPLSRSPGAAAPLSPQQSLYWCPERPEENGDYMIPIVYRIPARVEPARMARCLAEVVRRHEVLRTVFRQEEGHARAIVLPEETVPLPVVDCRALPDPLRQDGAERLVRDETLQVFRLDQGPLATFKLLCLEEESWILLATFHHSVFDGWSLSVFSRELSRLYEALAAGTAGRPSPLPEPVLQYSDFARWKETWLAGPEAERQRGYWRETLSGLPHRGVQHTLPCGEAVLCFQTIPEDLTGRLRELARSGGATLFTVMLAGFQALLYTCSGEEDLCLISIAAARTRKELCDLIGCFIHRLPVRTSLAGDPTLHELLERARDSALGAFAHPDVPFNTLLKDLAAQGEKQGVPREIQFLFQNFPAAPLRIGGREILPEETTFEGTEMPLILTVNEAGDGLTGEWQGHGTAFDACRLALLAESYEDVLWTLVTDPETRLSGLPAVEGDLIEILTFLLQVEET